MDNGTRIFSRSLGRIAVFWAAAAMAASWAGADETLYCTRYVTAVPYVISQPGHYCLVGNLMTPLASGIAIRIAADFVWLDLNNHALDGSAAGPGTAATGILSEGQKHVTVRNGVVRGFRTGIVLGADTGAEGLTIEGIHADRNTHAAIRIFATGAGNVVRSNRVSNTGGTTFLNLTGITGIAVAGDVSVIDNDVVNTFSSHPQPGNAAYGIFLGGPVGTQFKAVAVDNRVSRSTDVGIQCNDRPGAEVILRDNIVVAAPLPYTGGCTMVGTTNYP
jgi:hypothetical protein